MPKIAIDISPLQDGNSVRGVGYYTKNLIDALQKEIAADSEFQNYSVQLVTNRDQLKTGFDLIHYPFFDPFFLTLPGKSNIPFIITIHDIIPRILKKYYPVGLKGELKWLVQRHRARSANYIITPSHTAKYEIADIFNYPTDRIYVTHEAADSSFKRLRDKKLFDSIRRKYHLPPKFILYLGDLNVNKNIPILVNACLNLKYPLVIVGKQATELDKLALQQPSLTRPLDLIRHLLNLPSPQLKHVSILKDLFTNPLIHRLGFVPDTDLPTIFNLATIYCQPSFAEGFGLPLVQAMQSGTPVVYSNQSSLPEIVDFNGEFFDPYSQVSLETALKKLWTDPSLRRTYSQAGIKRSKVFTWKKTAIQTLSVYHIALHDGQK